MNRFAIAEHDAGAIVIAACEW